MENTEAAPTTNDNVDLVPSPIESMDSPYNPEFASPFDMGSPVDAVEAVSTSGN